MRKIALKSAKKRGNIYLNISTALIIPFTKYEYSNKCPKFPELYVVNQLNPATRSGEKVEEHINISSMLRDAV